MSDKGTRVCPVEKAGWFDHKIRKWFQNPRKILDPYVKEGMTVLDIGCGPGFFSIEMAEMAGNSGHVIASDLQEGMLRKLRDKIIGTSLEKRITLHQCEENKIGVPGNVDFVLAFYIVHEVPNQDAFLQEIASMLKPDGQVLIVEPPLHVSRAAFEETIGKARKSGLTPVERPKVLFSKTVILKKNG